MVSERRARTHENATVRWTVATRRLDAGCSIVYSSPVARTREAIRTGNSGEVERIAVFADILLVFLDGLRYNETIIRRKRKGPDITGKWKRFGKYLRRTQPDYGAASLYSRAMADGAIPERKEGLPKKKTGGT